MISLTIITSEFTLIKEYGCHKKVVTSFVVSLFTTIMISTSISSLCKLYRMTSIFSKLKLTVVELQKNQVVSESCICECRMSQLNQGTNTALPAEAPIKRKRGRPRKDENQAFPRPPVPIIQGQGSGAPKAISNIPSKGKDSVEDVDDDDDNKDEMVGQVVNGILEYAFDAGYFLTVKVGDTNVCMRGVVFKEDCIIPITPENDIAPNAKMYRRKDFPIPAMKFSPQIVQTSGNSSLNITENIKDQQQEKLSDDREQDKLSSYDKEQQEKLASDDKEQQEKLSDDKEQQDKLSDDPEDKEQQEKLPKDSSEPPMKLQKTEMTVNFFNGENKQCSGVTDENFADAVKSDEVANNKEAIIIPPQTAISAEDLPVVVTTVMEHEISRTSDFQISMENAEEDEDDVSEPPSVFSTMETD